MTVLVDRFRLLPPLVGSGWDLGPAIPGVLEERHWLGPRLASVGID